MIRDAVAMKTNNPDEVRYCCTECGDDGFHLYYNIRKHVFHCMKCGHRGKRIPEKEYSEAALEEMFAILQGTMDIVETQSLLILPVCEPVRPGSMAMRYMLNRGVPRSKVDAMGCMTSTDFAYENRIIIPVYDRKGQVIFYQGRALLKSMKPKYLNPVTPKKGVLFYNMGHTLPDSLPHLYVVEGIFKALKFWELGIPAVAVFGKEITKEQASMIWSRTESVTIMLDPDAFNFGIQMADQLLAMRDWVKARVILPPKAPDDMSAKELIELLEVEGCDTTRM